MAEVDVPAPGGTFSGATTDRGRTPGGRFNGDGISGFVATALQDSILWIGPNVPTADQFVLWINTTDGRWYGKWNDGDSTQWVDLSLPFGEGLPGPQGPQGERGLTGPVGEGIPTGGAANEILVKVDATDYNTAWGARPADGLNVLNGAAAPTGGDGVDGEFWIDTTAWDIYGPKSGGAWPAGVSLVGPAGDTGATGAGVPVGGTAGQKLEKIDGTDYNTQWVDDNEPPAGGTAGQALRKTDGTDYNYAWADVDEVPDGGTAGQFLSKVDGTDQNLAWSDPPASLPSGGTAGQVLTKDTSTDYDVSWQDPSPTASEEIAGTSYTFVAADAQKWKYTSNASAVTLTIDASVHSVDDEVFIEQRGTGLVTFTNAVGTTINSRDSLVASNGQYSVMGFKVISGTEVRLFGDLA